MDIGTPLPSGQKDPTEGQNDITIYVVMQARACFEAVPRLRPSRSNSILLGPRWKTLQKYEQTICWLASTQCTISQISCDTGCLLNPGLECLIRAEDLQGGRLQGVSQPVVFTF
jgi:hypothetical protein